MVELLSVAQRSRIAPLFHGWEETMIWSCLQGCMGRAWADRPHSPGAGQILVGDFCLLAGTPTDALVRHIPPEFGSDFLLLIPRTADWHPLIRQVWDGRCTQTLRYAIRKEPGVFDPDLLRACVGRLPPGYTLRPIDEALWRRTREEAWCRDLCSQFPAWEDYRLHGLGFMALRDGRPAAGASSYLYYNGGIELEVDTHPHHRRRGLALACAAALILACLERGLYPSWDAHDPRSAALAQKLGYRPGAPYPTFILSEFR